MLYYNWILMIKHGEKIDALEAAWILPLRACVLMSYLACLFNIA
jgi:hypothetical protein